MTVLPRLPLVALLLLCPLLLGEHAAAQTAAAPQTGGAPVAATEESRREAHALADLLKFQARAEATVAQMRLSAVRSVAQSSGKSAEEAGRIVDELIMPDFKELQPQVEALLTENLAAAFTAGELRQLRNFFTSPIGQRFLQLMPGVDRDGQRQILLLGQKTFHAAVEAHAEALRARGVAPPGLKP